MFNLILIDFSWLYNRYFFIVKSNVGIKEEIPEEMEKRLGQFLSLIGKSYPTAKIVMALDPPTSSLKNSAIYKEYKQNRDKEGKKEVYSCFREIVNHLNSTLGENYSFVKVQEYEADQVIASLCEKYHDLRQILIYSGDKDLLQLTALSNVYSSEKFEKGQFILRTDKDIFSKFKNSKKEDFTRISTNKKDILKYRTLKGDSSDNIPPVFPRIKDSEIVSIIKDYWTDKEDTLSEERINDIIDSVRDNNQVLAEKLDEAKDNWLRNYKIMNLFGLENMEIRRIKKN